MCYRTSNCNQPHVALEVNIYAQQGIKANLHFLENIIGCAKCSIVYLVQKGIDLILVVPEIINECVVRFNWTECECRIMLMFKDDLVAYQQWLVEKKKTMTVHIAVRTNETISRVIGTSLLSSGGSCFGVSMENQLADSFFHST